MDSKMGRSNRNRGADAERQVARLFQALGFRTVRRGQVFNRESDVIGVPGLHIEVKYQKKTKVWDWIEQAETEAEIRRDGSPVVWFRRPHQTWNVIVPGKLFLDMYTAWAEKNGVEHE